VIVNVDADVAKANVAVRVVSRFPAVSTEKKRSVWTPDPDGMTGVLPTVAIVLALFHE
jgi:hypothetical protein